MKNLLITGGSRGLGRAMIHRFHLEGWNVFTTVRKPEDAEKLKKEYTQRMNIIQVDLAEDTCVEVIKERMKQKIETLDLLINNAGIPGDATEIEKLSSAEMFRLFNVHCLSVIRTVQATLDLLKVNNNAKVINITSRLGSLNATASGEFENLVTSYSYRVAKAGQNMLSICMEKELRKYGISIYAIHPGRLMTDCCSTDADGTPEKAAEKICQWVNGEAQKYHLTYVEPYEREWPW